MPSDTEPSSVTMMIYFQLEHLTLTWSEIDKKNARKMSGESQVKWYIYELGFPDITEL